MRFVARFVFTAAALCHAASQTEDRRLFQVEFLAATAEEAHCCGRSPQCRADESITGCWHECGTMLPHGNNNGQGCYQFKNLCQHCYPHAVSSVAQARCCAEHPDCIASGGPRGCVSWCSYRSRHNISDSIQDQCYEYRHLCVNCYPDALRIPVMSDTNKYVHASRQHVNGLAVQISFVLMVLLQRPSVVLLMSYIFETALWVNHRYQITDPYPFIEDPLFTVAGSLIGIGWSFAFIRYWKTPAFFPAPTRLLSARLLGIATASVVGSMVIIFRSSALLSFIQRCFSGKLQSLSVKDASAAVQSSEPGWQALLIHTIWITLTVVASGISANSSSSALQRWSSAVPESPGAFRIARDFWICCTLTQLCFGILLAVTSPQLEFRSFRVWAIFVGVSLSAPLCLWFRSRHVPLKKAEGAAR
jgi:hypothetical protein